jgi:hypothetical protein
LDSLHHGVPGLATLAIFLLQECIEIVAFVSQLAVSALQLLVDLDGIKKSVIQDGAVPFQAFIVKGQLRHLSHQ